MFISHLYKLALLAEDFKIKAKDLAQITPEKLAEMEKMIKAKDAMIEQLSFTSFNLSKSNIHLEDLLRDREQENILLKKKLETYSNKELNDLRERAECDDKIAQFELCCYYYNNDGSSAKKALKWLKDSVNNGYDAAQVELGLLYLRGNDELNIPISYVSLMNKA